MVGEFDVTPLTPVAVRVTWNTSLLARSTR
jgi:hypothetical protein